MIFYTLKLNQYKIVFSETYKKANALLSAFTTYHQYLIKLIKEVFSNKILLLPQNFLSSVYVLSAPVIFNIYSQ